MIVKSRKALVIMALTVAAVGVAVAVRLNRDHAARTPAPVGVETVTTSPVPTLVELGSDSCTSCKAMAAVLDELRSAHGPALNVRFVDVWKDPEGGEAFGASVIPTQVLLGPDGRELARHTGYWSADAIRKAFATHGFPLPEAPQPVSTRAPIHG